MDDKGLMRLKGVQDVFHKELGAIYEKEEIDSFFYVLIEAYYTVTRMQLALRPDYKVANYDVILNALRLLKKEQPIQYILGDMEFYGLPFKVNNDVLIPRPETEELVEWVIKQVDNKQQTANNYTILDIGTGSGCIAVSLAKSLPKVKVYALDVSKEALKIAEQNAELNNVAIEFIEANILDTETFNSDFKNLKFDIIVSNPPYVREQEKEFMKPNVINNEPHLALFVKDEKPLQFYEAITQFALGNLKDKGLLFFEINEYLGNDMIQLLKKNNFNNIKLKQDIFKKDRMIKGEKTNE
ncbi:peptide chain release factor N(5)-glutamine methyltransferase [Flavivirga spongiicola]|uniref:Release factor glutamine methyltransferase n=1 Tax=Flavivirga spongiicola TaxID=421621 RepID=A0ABU7Y017_9FLAO|nr:peptide chain release factor N(5)-glutamine methyltransferase [Flavivirga sp. MEBiC05379]MDO5981197.1 peptide chain release factor N(5)-glutamine methyltransferase [Flavivirga sp. MEBiC05379]